MKPLEEMGQFKTVVIDPPWDLPWVRLGPRGKKDSNYPPVPYESLNLAQLRALAVPHVLERDAIVFCWAINTVLPDALRLLEYWGLEYWFMMVWHKTGGPKGISLPTYNGEYVVVAKAGQPNFLDTKAFKTVNCWPRGAHNEKPEGFYDLLRRVTPGPRLDIFGRRRIAGFTSWGNEAPEGEALPDHYQMVLG